MKKLILTVPFMALIIIFNACSNDSNDNDIKIDLSDEEILKLEIDKLKVAIAPYTNLDDALAAGYDVDLTGYISQAGHHYFNTSISNGNFKLEKPEVILFDQDMVFVGVEYLIPITSANEPAPEGFTGSMDVWHKVSTENFWQLHVWIGIDPNPNGMFATTNPNLP